LIERIDAQRVYERDAWRCHICRRRISKSRRYPDQKSASLDHIVPLSEGGRHEYRNVASAHLLCNMSKNAKSFGQLRLIA
jgi:5-methylcytosine-specific restriction endonuclease McrA